MATTSNPIPPMPKPDVPVVDPKTGRMTREWYDFLAAWRKSAAKVREEIP